MYLYFIIGFMIIFIIFFVVFYIVMMKKAIKKRKEIMKKNDELRELQIQKLKQELQKDDRE